MVTKSAIETKDLATRDEDKEAVNGVTLATVEGKCCRLLKPNGVGKTTTTMSMLSTIAKPTSDSRVEMSGAPVRFKTLSNDAMDLQQTMETYAGRNSSGRSVNERDRSILVKDWQQCERVT